MPLEPDSVKLNGAGRISHKSAGSRRRGQKSSPSRPFSGSLQDEAVVQAQNEKDRLKLIYEFTTEINKHRYDLYNWCETKIQSLITVDSILLGALIVTINGHLKLNDWTNALAVGIAAALLTSSLAISLWHIEPKMDSKVGNYDNPRSSIGIAMMTKEEYYQKHMQLTCEEMIYYNCLQTKGMNKIIMTNQRAIRIAALSTIASLLPILVIAGKAFVR
jgi:hypothetical protein